MKICYIVYREDNVMVFDSQVLEYLKALKEFPEVEEVTLVLFRHEEHLFQKKAVQEKMLRYVDQCVSFASFPPLHMGQLHTASRKLKGYLARKYQKQEPVAVICRGDLAAYVGAKAFSGYPNSRILYDNRGLSLEESEMTHGDAFLHRRNRSVKRRAMAFAGDHCDMYNFVTSALRAYMLDKYAFDSERPYTIIPTLYRAEPLDAAVMTEVKKLERWRETDFVVTYVGSTAAWQATSQLENIISRLADIAPCVRFFVLTNGNIQELDKLRRILGDRLTIKNIPHARMPYYLAMSEIGVVIRDDNVVNRVAAPTKIAEYLTNGLKILYSGQIGVIADLKSILDRSTLIEYGQNTEWAETIAGMIGRPRKEVDRRVAAYFDMQTRQQETLAMIRDSFRREKRG